MTKRIRSLPFAQVDVFGNGPFKGNPVAVVFDLDPPFLSTEDMQNFANWTNLSETTFVSVPADPEVADYSLRIFTTSRELPFAGHPTLGSCYAWLHMNPATEFRNSGGHRIIYQECVAGLIKLRQNLDTGILSFEAPPLNTSGPLDEAEVSIIARGLGIPREGILHHAWCDNGPRWRCVFLDSAETVLSLQANAEIFGEMDVGVVGLRSKVGAIGLGKGQGVGSYPDSFLTSQRRDGAMDINVDYDFEVRAFCPLDAPFEDPVTGSLNAAIAQWLLSAGLCPSEGYVVRQGTKVGRDGRVYIQIGDLEPKQDVDRMNSVQSGGIGTETEIDHTNATRSIWVGGSCSIGISGMVNL